MQAIESKRFILSIKDCEELLRSFDLAGRGGFAGFEIAQRLAEPEVIGAMGTRATERSKVHREG
jgi:hypothetical protein